MSKRIRSIAEESMNRLVAYDWPGNVRELRNVIERSVILCSGDTLTMDDSFAPTGISSGVNPSALSNDLQSIERSKIEHALQRSNWKVKGPGGAAEALGLKPSSLRYRMQRLGITRPQGS